MVHFSILTYLCAGLTFGNVCVPCHKFYVLRVKEQIEEECVFPCDGISEKLLSYKNRECTLFVLSEVDQNFVRFSDSSAKSLQFSCSATLALSIFFSDATL